MTKKKSATDIVRIIVDELMPLDSEERQRVVRASLTLLGEASTSVTARVDDHENDQNDLGLSARSRSWIKQNDLSTEHLTNIFHLGNGEMEIIASDIPGKTNRDKVRNAYVLLGIGHLLNSGEAKFEDKAARALCERYGFYDQTNHMKYMKGGNEFTGSKEAGWTVTAPGLKHGASVIKELFGAKQ